MLSSGFAVGFAPVAGASSVAGGGGGLSCRADPDPEQAVARMSARYQCFTSLRDMEPGSFRVRPHPSRGSARGPWSGTDRSDRISALARCLVPEATQAIDHVLKEERRFP